MAVVDNTFVSIYKCTEDWRVIPLYVQASEKQMEKLPLGVHFGRLATDAMVCQQRILSEKSLDKPLPSNDSSEGFWVEDAIWDNPTQELRIKLYL